MVLCLGLYTLWKGGAASATWSNKLMRIRVLAQFIAIMIIMAVLYFAAALKSKSRLALYVSPRNDSAQ